MYTYTYSAFIHPTNGWDDLNVSMVSEELAMEVAQMCADSSQMPVYLSILEPGLPE